MRSLARSVSRSAGDTACRSASATSVLVEHHVPYVEADEEVFSPAVEVLLGGHRSIEVMVADHAQIVARIAPLVDTVRFLISRPREIEASEPRAQAFRRCAMVVLHFRIGQMVLGSIVDVGLSDAAAEALCGHSVTEPSITAP